MDPRNQKCSSCTRRGQKCENRFHGDNEWRKLEQAKSDLGAQLRVARAMFAEHSRKLTESLAKIERLEKHESFLNERGVKMLNHDASVSERLDEDDPPNDGDLREIERLVDEQEVARLAAVSDDPSLSQMMNSPSFWNGLALPSSGNFALPGDSPSNLR